MQAAESCQLYSSSSCHFKEIAVQTTFEASRGTWQERLTYIKEMMREMSLHTDPQEMVKAYARHLVMSEQVQAAYAAVDRELKIVADIQRSLLPKTLPSVPTIDLAVDYQTSHRAGG